MDTGSVLDLASPGMATPGEPDRPGYGQPQPGGLFGRPPRADGKTGLSGLLAPQPDMPPDIGVSYLCWLGALALSAVGGVLGVVQVLTLSSATQGFVIGATMVGLLVRLAVLAGVAFVVLLMRAGFGWARIVLSVLGGLTALGCVVTAVTAFTADFSLLGPAWQTISKVSAVLDLAQLGLIVVAAVFMFRPPANDYFAQPR